MQTLSQAKIIELLLIDCSTSMSPFQGELNQALATHVADLQAAPNAAEIGLAAWTFSGYEPSLLVQPMPVQQVRTPQIQHFDGGTPLYTSVRSVIELMLLMSRDTKLVLNVLTDGDDRGSHPDDLGLLRTYLVPAALQRGHTLSIVGLGIDGSRIARQMGFIADGSLFIPQTNEGFQASFKHMTMMTLGPQANN